MNKFSLQFLLCCVTVCALSSSAGALESKPLDDLLEANGVANIVIVAADNLVPATETCGVNSEESLKISGSVHASLDGAIAAYIASVGKSKTYGQKNWTSCLDQCTCSVYSSVLEEIGFENLNMRDKTIYRRVSSLAREQTPQDTIRCVRANQKYCTSDVLKSARADAK